MILAADDSWKRENPVPLSAAGSLESARAPAEPA
jgi:hypothetical protein